MKKLVSMFLAMVMAIAMFAMPASAGWLDPQPTESEIRALANREEISQEELSALANKYVSSDFWAVCEQTLSDDMIAIATMKQNRPDRDNAALSQIYMKYVNLYMAVYPDDPDHEGPEHSSYARKANRAVQEYNKKVVETFGVTMAKRPTYSSGYYTYAVDALEVQTDYNKMYRCHFIGDEYDGESFLINARNGQSFTVGKTYEYQRLSFILLGNTLDGMENVAYISDDELSDVELDALEYDAYTAFDSYHDSNFNLFQKYVAMKGYYDMVWY